MAEKAPSPVPIGMDTVTPQIFFNGNCKEALEFYKKAFNAEIIGEVVPSPDGKTVWHAMVKIGNSICMMNDCMPEGYEQGPKGNTTIGIWLYVDDCDAWFNKAVAAGAEVTMPLMDMFWGDRMAKLKDPYGHSWDIATHQWVYTPEEMKTKEEEMMAMMKKQ